MVSVHRLKPFFLGCQDRLGISRLPSAAVVTAERVKQVATFSLQHVAQDDATKAQLRLRMKQNTFVAIANAARPKGHDLHITPGTSA